MISVIFVLPLTSRENNGNIHYHTPKNKGKTKLTEIIEKSNCNICIFLLSPIIDEFLNVH